MRWAEYITWKGAFCAHKSCCLIQGSILLPALPFCAYLLECASHFNRAFSSWDDFGADVYHSPRLQVGGILYWQHPGDWADTEGTWGKPLGGVPTFTVFWTEDQTGEVSIFKESVDYLGHTLPCQALAPTKERIATIVQVSAPSNKVELKSF